MGEKIVRCHGHLLSVESTATDYYCPNCGRQAIGGVDDPERVTRTPRNLATVGGKESVLVLFVRHGDQVNADWLPGSEAERWGQSLTLCGATVQAFDAEEDVNGDVWIEVRIDL